MKYIILIGLLCINDSLFSQQSNRVISGTVVDKISKQPVEFVNVVLLTDKDSIVVKGTVTDKKGRYTLTDITPGNYSVRYTYIGYAIPETKRLIITREQTAIQLGTIELSNRTTTLNEVVVTGKKSMLRTSIGRKVYQVSQDLMSKSGSASDILKNIPSVEIDIEGNVNLRGSGEVMILINGRPSPLMGKNRAEVLQQLPANSIERIEVITNPSARFRPDGTSGIINIVLKKNTTNGMTGNIIGNIGNRERSNGSLNLNYKKGKFNSFITYNIRQDERNRFNELDRTYFDSTGKISGYYEENGKLKARPLSHLLRGGIDYSINEKNSIGFSVNYIPSGLTRNDLVQRYYFDKNNQLTNQFNRTRYAPATEYENDATLYWQRNFKKEDEELRVEATISAQAEDEKNYYNNIYNYPPQRSLPDNNWVNQIEKNQQVTVDYVNPLTEKSKLEIGYAGSFIQQDIDFYVEDFDTLQNKFIPNNLRSNRFLYNESVQAVYGTWQHTYDAFSFSLGLRAEAAHTKVNLQTKDSIINNQYFQLYPTLHLAYQLRKGELQLNYSRRVNRPDGDDMNPFPEYIDPLNLRAGNPKLLPEYIHSVELGYQLKGEKFSFVPSIYYRYKYNGFTTVTKPINDSVLLTTRENLSNDQSAGIELIASFNSAKFFSANLSANIFYNSINADNLGILQKKSIVSFSTNFISTFTFTPNTQMQLSCNYRSARQTAQGQFFPTFVINMGARQDLFKKKLAITLTLSDVFKTLRQKVTLNTAYFNQTAITSRDARVLYIGFSYRFGTAAKKPVTEKMQFDNNL
jgi:outer membrane receptor protein involved in Fe transport